MNLYYSSQLTPISDDPKMEPDPLKPLELLQRFKCFFECQFGNHKLLYSAEIDGVESEEPLKEPVNWKDVKFVELKQRNDNFITFLKHKSLNTWAQTYITGIDETVYGLRGKDGIVRQLEYYTIDRLACLSKVDVVLLVHFYMEK